MPMSEHGDVIERQIR